MFKKKKYFLVTYCIFGVEKKLQKVVIAKDEDMARVIFNLHYTIHSYIHISNIEEIECLK